MQHLFRITLTNTTTRRIVCIVYTVVSVSLVCACCCMSFLWALLTESDKWIIHKHILLYIKGDIPFPFVYFVWHWHCLDFNVRSILSSFDLCVHWCFLVCIGCRFGEINDYFAVQIQSSLLPFDSPIFITVLVIHSISSH